MFKQAFCLILLAFGFSTTLVAEATLPEQHLSPPACPPGCKVVEETCYKEVCRDVCKTVPDVKKIKKWVYTCKCEPFCVSVGGSQGCGECSGKGCAACKGPYNRTLLIKREVVVDEIITNKCVVEKVTEIVPYKTYRIIPCEAPCVVPTEPAQASLGIVEIDLPKGR